MSYLFYFLCFFSFAEEQKVPVIENELVGTQGQLPVPIKVSNQGSCYFCSLPKTNNKNRIGEICGDDPYSVICSNLDGQNKDKKKTKEDVNKVIADAEKKALLSMGYNSMDAAVKAELAKSGMEGNFRDLTFRQAIKSGDVNRIGSAHFTVSNNCGKNSSADSSGKLSNYDNSLAGKSAQLNELSEQLISLRRSIKPHEQSSKDLLTANPLLVFKDLLSACRESTSFNSNKESPVYRKLLEDCRELSSIESEAIDLNRGKGASLNFSRTKGKDFYERFTYLQYTRDEIYKGSATGVDKDIEVIKLNIKNERNRSSKICYSILSATSTVGAEIVKNTILKVHTNKIFIDHVMKELYSVENQGSFSDIAEQSRKSVIGAVDQLFPGEQNRAGIKESLAKIQVQSVSPASSDKFSAVDGVLYLDPSQLTESSLSDQIYSGFLDPSLFFFRGSNAYYSPQFGGAGGHVCPIGEMFHMARSNPYAVFTIFAHEFGHSIDANDTNALGLLNDYQKTLACYKSGDSIKMLDHQRGETTADSIAATALAKELEQLPQDQRASTYVEALKPYCDFSSVSGSVDRKHPHSKLRLNGIFSAHPSLRKAIGCSNEKYKYKICPQH